MASDFGASSPSTTCNMVTIASERARLSPTETPGAMEPTSGSRMCSKAGSASAPSPMLAMVMPSWQAAR